MEFLKNEELKKKYIAGVAAAVVAIGGLYFMFGDKEEPAPQGSALSQGATLSKGVEEPTLNITKPKTTINFVEHGKYISIDNLSITRDEVDKLLMYAIKEADIDRVKYILDSGASIEFSDDTICSPHIGEYGPKNITAPNYNIGIDSRWIYLNGPDTIYTTTCETLFLQTALFELAKYYKYSPEHLVIFGPLANGNRDIVSENQKEEYSRRLAMVKFLISITPKKDYHQFLNILTFEFKLKGSALSFSNNMFEKDLIIEIASLYFNNINNIPYSELRTNTLNKFYNNIREFEKNKNSEDFYIYKYNNPIQYIFEERFKYLLGLMLSAEYKTGEQERNSIKRFPNAITPYLTLNGIINFNVSPNVENLDDITYFKRQALKYYFEDFAILNRELEIINFIMKNNRINFSHQDHSGNSLLHFTSKSISTHSGLNIYGDRSLAIFSRFLLNLGADPNLLNKNGKTPLGIILSYPDLVETRKAFTSKDYGNEKRFIDKSLNGDSIVIYK